MPAFTFLLHVQMNWYHCLLNIACVGSLRWPRGFVTLKTAADMQTLVLVSVGGLSGIDIQAHEHSENGFVPFQLELLYSSTALGFISVFLSLAFCCFCHLPGTQPFRVLPR